MESQKYLDSVGNILSSLKQERKETQEMFRTLFRSLAQHLPNGRAPTEHEILNALEQLKDVHRMAGLLLVAALPGSVVTLPALCALGRRFDVELLPSAFRKS